MTDPTPKQKALAQIDKAVTAVGQGAPHGVLISWLTAVRSDVEQIDERVDGRKHKKKGGPLDDPNVTR